MRFHQYFKIAGSFCSQARKAVLASENPDFIKNLIMTGKGMEEKKNSFISCCRKFLSPWLDIAQLTVCKRSVRNDFVSRWSQNIPTVLPKLLLL